MADKEQPNSQLSGVGETLGRGLGKAAGALAEGTERGRRLTRSYAQDAKLNIAVRAGRLGKTREALRLGADPNICVTAMGPTKSRTGTTALAYAVVNGYYRVAEELLEAGAEVNRVVGGKGSTTSLIDHLATRGRINEAEEQDILRLAGKMIERGADVGYQRSPTVYQPTFLHRLTGSCNRPELAKKALMHGAPLDGKNEQGKTPEENINRNLSGKFKEQADKMYQVLRLHRLAPCPSFEEGAPLSRKELGVRQENGYCALDHWHSWDNFEQMQEGLKAQGDRLTARDLLVPLGGIKGGMTRLEAMIPACPGLTEKLFDKDLWEGESVDTLSEFCKRLPPDVREKAPYYSLRIKLRSEQSQTQTKGR